MQPYFDPTRKTTLKKYKNKGRWPLKKWGEMEENLKKKEKKMEEISLKIVNQF